LKRAKAARSVIEKRPSFQGWSSTDSDEIDRRRWRGQTEIVDVEPLEPEQPFFGTYRVRSISGTAYLVEIRSLESDENSCGCHDFWFNGLDTCKHIEGVLHRLRSRRKRAFAAAARRGSPRVEIHAPPRQERISVTWPALEVPKEAHALVRPLVEAGDDKAGAIAAVRAALAGAPAEVADAVRLSRHLDRWLEDRQHQAERVAARQAFLSDVAAGRANFDVVHLPLLPYQREGVLHLAFGERVLLADEMGLGKTVQAIAACELLRRRRGIERVLVVSPASLKAEWQDQIGRFSDLSVNVVYGNRDSRLKAYQSPAFFNLTNYEQVIGDFREINERLRPDVVVLDEAQRIKNWQTKTARAVKALRSRYAFVLTGTPLENRIDEIYSIVQFLDPGLLGPLFRFNRDFYVLDERGRPADYQNLDELHRRLRPVMLRRRKTDVEEQLPGRTIKTYFVGMTAEQQQRYAEYEARVARLVHVARRRPLTAQEFERLQRWLACMRMLCDTPFILDADCRDCPKLEELERLLSDIFAEPGRKVIIFSEWERMLSMVRDLAGEMGLDHAWHTGSVPQDKRRGEIHRFKQDPACRLFLSTDSGSVGLNLQAAEVVINLDLPWNPAKLEQRIARAWRKHQTRPVHVFNLVAENSIEHRMLHVLGQKQTLADGVLDGHGDLRAIKLPSGRAAFVERLDAMMGKSEAERAARPEPAERLRDDLEAAYGDELLLVQAHSHAAGRQSLLIVLGSDAAAARQDIERRVAKIGERDTAPPVVEVLDRGTWATVQRLVAAGDLSFTAAQSRDIHRSPRLDDAGTDEQERRLRRARELFGQADRKSRMAALLATGGFGNEALAPLAEAGGLALRAVLALDGDENPAAEGAAEAVSERGLLPGEMVRLAAPMTGESTDEDLTARLTATERLIEATRVRLRSAA
jgi:superfamily II DNA or RNA helicase